MNKFSIVTAVALAFTLSAAAQGTSKTEVPKSWHVMDPATSGFNGISLDKAYELLKTKNLKSNRVVVAVIDSGIDTAHEDLKPILWTNPGEIAGNNIDDDKNGYIDDVHGWNFIGGRDGRNVAEDSYEAARVYHKLKVKWENKTAADAVTAADKKEFADYARAKEKVADGVNPAQAKMMANMFAKFTSGDSLLRKELGKEEYTAKDVEAYTGTDLNAKAAKSILMSIARGNGSTDMTNQQLIEGLGGEVRKAESAGQAPRAYRQEITKDDESNLLDRNYGNNDLMATTSMHGTHCSGIIAAARNNEKGMDGVADNVRIMTVRAVPDGDEHDKDIANAIYYAVDNGAQIISMSFGKDFSPEKKWVDDAFRYAASKNVLLVHAAGNDSKNVDTTFNFPNPVFADGKGKAVNVITVGASGDPKNGGITAAFSNYGKSEVDVFAPGVNIYSTIPGGNTYGKLSGTSMACPVVAGVAALLLQYYPNLTAIQLKEAIEKSTVAPKDKVKNPETKDLVPMSDLSRSGGIVNAFEAVKYAGTIKTTKKPVLKETKIKRTTNA